MAILHVLKREKGGREGEGIKACSVPGGSSSSSSICRQKIMKMQES